jgi:hypothetical protein
MQLSALAGIANSLVGVASARGVVLKNYGDSVELSAPLMLPLQLKAGPTALAWAVWTPDVVSVVGRPTITGIVPPEAAAGQELLVLGTGFLPAVDSEELWLEIGGVRTGTWTAVTDGIARSNMPHSLVQLGLTNATVRASVRGPSRPAPVTLISPMRIAWDDVTWAFYSGGAGADGAVAAAGGGGAGGGVVVSVFASGSDTPFLPLPFAPQLNVTTGQAVKCRLEASLVPGAAVAGATAADGSSVSPIPVEPVGAVSVVPPVDTPAWASGTDGALVTPFAGVGIRGPVGTLVQVTGSCQDRAGFVGATQSPLVVRLASLSLADGGFPDSFGAAGATASPADVTAAAPLVLGQLLPFDTLPWTLGVQTAAAAQVSGSLPSNSSSLMSCTVAPWQTSAATAGGVASSGASDVSATADATAAAVCSASSALRAATALDAPPSDGYPADTQNISVRFGTGLGLRSAASGSSVGLRRSCIWLSTGEALPQQAAVLNLSTPQLALQEPWRGFLLRYAAMAAACGAGVQTDNATGALLSSGRTSGVAYGAWSPDFRTDAVMRAVRWAGGRPLAWPTAVPLPPVAALPPLPLQSLRVTVTLQAQYHWLYDAAAVAAELGRAYTCVLRLRSAAVASGTTGANARSAARNPACADTADIACPAVSVQRVRAGVSVSEGIAADLATAGAIDISRAVFGERVVLQLDCSLRAAAGGAGAYRHSWWLAELSIQAPQLKVAEAWANSTALQATEGTDGANAVFPGSLRDRLLTVLWGQSVPLPANTSAAVAAFDATSVLAPLANISVDASAGAAAALTCGATPSASSVPAPAMSCCLTLLQVAGSSGYGGNASAAATAVAAPAKLLWQRRVSSFPSSCGAAFPGVCLNFTGRATGVSAAGASLSAALQFSVECTWLASGARAVAPEIDNAAAAASGASVPAASGVIANNGTASNATAGIGTAGISNSSLVNSTTAPTAAASAAPAAVAVSGLSAGSTWITQVVVPQPVFVPGGSFPDTAGPGSLLPVLNNTDFLLRVQVLPAPPSEAKARCNLAVDAALAALRGSTGVLADAAAGLFELTAAVHVRTAPLLLALNVSCSAYGQALQPLQLTLSIEAPVVTLAVVPASTAGSAGATAAAGCSTLGFPSWILPAPLQTLVADGVVSAAYAAVDVSPAPAVQLLTPRRVVTLAEARSPGFNASAAAPGGAACGVPGFALPVGGATCRVSVASAAGPLQGVATLLEHPSAGSDGWFPVAPSSSAATRFNLSSVTLRSGNLSATGLLALRVDCRRDLPLYGGLATPLHVNVSVLGLLFDWAAAPPRPLAVGERRWPPFAVAPTLVLPPEPLMRAAERSRFLNVSASACMRAAAVADEASRLVTLSNASFASSDALAGVLPASALSIQLAAVLGAGEQALPPPLWAALQNATASFQPSQAGVGFNSSHRMQLLATLSGADFDPPAAAVAAWAPGATGNVAECAWLQQLPRTVALTTCVSDGRAEGSDPDPKLVSQRSQQSTQGNGSFAFELLKLNARPGSSAQIAATCSIAGVAVSTVAAAVQLAGCPPGYSIQQQNATGRLNYLCSQCGDRFYSPGGTQACRPCGGIGVQCDNGFLSALQGFSTGEDVCSAGESADVGAAVVTSASLSGAVQLLPGYNASIEVLPADVLNLGALSCGGVAFEFTTPPGALAELHACPFPAACTFDGLRYGCAPGYAGSLCMRCAEGYARLSGRCLACPPSYISVAALAAYGALALLLPALCLCRSASRRRAKVISDISSQLLQPTVSARTAPARSRSRDEDDGWGDGGTDASPVKGGGAPTPRSFANPLAAPPATPLPPAGAAESVEVAAAGPSAEAQQEQQTAGGSSSNCADPLGLQVPVDPPRCVDVLCTRLGAGRWNAHVLLLLLQHCQEVYLLRQLAGLQGSLFSTATLWTIPLAETVATLPPLHCIAALPTPLQLAACLGGIAAIALEASLLPCCHALCCGPRRPRGSRGGCCGGPSSGGCGCCSACPGPRRPLGTGSGPGGDAGDRSSMRVMANPLKPKKGGLAAGSGKGGKGGSGDSCGGVGVGVHPVLEARVRTVLQQFSAREASCGQFSASLLRGLVHMGRWCAATLALQAVRQLLCRPGALQGTRYLLHDAGTVCLSPLNLVGMALAAVALAALIGIGCVLAAPLLLPRLRPALAAIARQQIDAEVALSGAAAATLLREPRDDVLLSRVMLHLLAREHATHGGAADRAFLADIRRSVRLSAGPANTGLGCGRQLVIAAAKIGLWHAEAYAPTRGWWAVTHLARVVAVAVLLLGVTDAALQGFGVLLVYALSLACAEGFQPYARRGHQNVATLQQIVCLLTALLSLFAVAARAAGAAAADAAGGAPGLTLTLAGDTVGYALIGLHGAVMALLLLRALPRGLCTSHRAEASAEEDGWDAAAAVAEAAEPRGSLGRLLHSRNRSGSTTDSGYFNARRRPSAARGAASDAGVGGGRASVPGGSGAPCAAAAAGAAGGGAGGSGGGGLAGAGLAGLRSRHSAEEEDWSSSDDEEEEAATLGSRTDAWAFVPPTPKPAASGVAVHPQRSASPAAYGGRGGRGATSVFTFAPTHAGGAGGTGGDGGSTVAIAAARAGLRPVFRLSAHRDAAAAAAALADGGGGGGGSGGGGTSLQQQLASNPLHALRPAGSHLHHHHHTNGAAGGAGGSDGDAASSGGIGDARPVVNSVYLAARAQLRSTGRPGAPAALSP